MTGSVWICLGSSTVSGKASKCRECVFVFGILDYKQDFHRKLALSCHAVDTTQNQRPSANKRSPGSVGLTRFKSTCESFAAWKSESSRSKPKVFPTNLYETPSATRGLRASKTWESVDTPCVCQQAHVLWNMSLQHGRTSKTWRSVETDQKPRRAFWKSCWWCPTINCY